MNTRFDYVREKIYGPVYPVPPAFNRAGDLDLKSVANYVEFLCSNNAKVLMITAGTSRLNLLSPVEITALNRTIAQTAGPGVLTICAIPPFGSTKMAVSLARQASEDGCGAMLLYYPDRLYSDEVVFDYFSHVASNSDIPLLIHGVPLESGRGDGRVPYSMDLCYRLAELEHIVGMKEEFGNEAVRYKLAAHLRERIPLIVAGSSMRKYLGSALYGVRSWLVGVGSFVPRIEETFFSLMKSKDYSEAFNIVMKVEEPLFDVAMPMGWHVAMRAMLDILGLMPGYERQPMVTATPKQKDKLIALADQLGWISHEGR